METRIECMKSNGRSHGIASVTRGIIESVWNGVQGFHERKLERTKGMNVTPYHWVTNDDSRNLAELEHWRSIAYANNSRYQIR